MNGRVGNDALKYWLIAALACMAMLASGEVDATPRGDVPPPEPETPEDAEIRRLKLAEEMAAWLPRLVGRFRYEGVVDFNPTSASPPDPLKLKSAKGLGDCVAIGTGPGVQCAVNVVWPEEWTSQGEVLPGGVSFLRPAAILYGIDPNAATIRYMQLDTDGLVTDGSAVLKGDTLLWTFTGYCESRPQDFCGHTFRIYAPPDGKYVQMYVEITRYPNRVVDVAASPLVRLNLNMRRVPQGPGGEASKAPAAGK